MASSSSSHALPTNPDVYQLGIPQYWPTNKMETRLVSIGGRIRNHWNWNVLIEDPKQVQDWMNEDRERGTGLEELKYVVSEQKYWAGQYPGNLTPSAIWGVFSADSAVSDELQGELLACVAALEEDSSRDWMLDPDRMVRNLIHPSLYHLSLGVTQALAPDMPPLTLRTCISAMGKGTVVMELPAAPNLAQSCQHAWLPSVFSISQTGSTEISSYINNLHPLEHAKMYPALARIFDVFVPLFEAVLEEEVNFRPQKVVADMWESARFDDEEELNEYGEEWDNHEFYLPSKFKPPRFPQKKWNVNLKGQELQVVVKMQSIHLTPDWPVFEGSSYVGEGVEDKAIVAVGMYFFDQDNVTQPKVSFRTPRMAPYDDDYSLSSTLGSCTPFVGRCICFANTLQFRIHELELLDREKPGHFKFLLFWLVNPVQPMPFSTGNVPPQQLDWFKKEIFSGEKEATFLSELPIDARMLLEERLDQTLKCPFSKERAEGYREELREEKQELLHEYIYQIFNSS